MSDDRDDPLFGPPDLPSGPSAPTGPTEPIRPLDPGPAPIPERVRQPIVVAHKESTIAGLPRPLFIAAVVGLAVALLAGFLIGRAAGGDEETPTSAARGGRRAACERALTLSLQVAELERQALTNRTQAAQALVVGDEGQVRELNSALEPLSVTIQETEAQLTPAVERCRSGGGRAKGGGKDAGNG